MYQGIAVERLDRINGEFILNWIKAVKNNHEDETTNKKSKIHFKICYFHLLNCPLQRGWQQSE